MITTVLLDIDDTLLDFTLGERMAIRQAFEQFHLPYDERFAVLYHGINASWWQRYDEGEVQVNQVVVGRFVDLFHAIAMPMPLNFAQVYEGILREQHAFIRGAKGFLERLGERYKVYAVSNGRAAVQSKRLADSGLDKLLDGVFVSETIGYHKPESQFFAYIARSVEGFDPHCTVLVGNSLSSDIAGGAAAGLYTVWYNREQLPLVGSVTPDFTSDDFRAIEAYINDLNEQ